ncbi:MAG: hypothetical protein ACTSSP_07200, partial [Candidatus Asgardarchaeia archaeon]
HSGINIINLKKDLDDLSVKESATSFLRGMKLDKGDRIESVADNLSKFVEEGNLEIGDNKRIECLLLLINTTCRNHLLTYKDEEEFNFIREFLKKVEIVARSKNVETLEKVHHLLAPGLGKRSKAFLKRKEKETLSSVDWDI